MHPSRTSQRDVSRVISSPCSRLTSNEEVQEVSIQLQQHPRGSSPPRSHLVTLHRPVPSNVTPREFSFHRRSYTSQQHSLPVSSQPYLVVTSPIPSRKMYSLQMSPLHAPRSPHHLTNAASLPYAAVASKSKVVQKPIPLVSKAGSPNGPSFTPHPFQVSPSSMMIRKPEPISWIKYPVEPQHIYPGPYAAVDLPFEGVNNNSNFEVLKASKKGRLSSTWGPQKLKCVEKSRKCVRFASTWGPAHPAGRPAEYATIDPRKLTSRYVRPAVFRRSHLNE